jgi:hypothetical protein
MMKCSGSGILELRGPVTTLTSSAKDCGHVNVCVWLTDISLHLISHSSQIHCVPSFYEALTYEETESKQVPS